MQEITTWNTQANHLKSGDRIRYNTYLGATTVTITRVESLWGETQIWYRCDDGFESDALFSDYTMFAKVA